MAVQEEARYLGLPVPSYQERYELEFVTSDLVPASIGTSRISELVQQYSPNVTQVITHDCDFFLEYECSPMLSEEEVITYVFGIQEGYDFTIGSLTYLNFIRSGYNTFDEYFCTIANRFGEIPVLTRTELERVKELRTGQARIDERAYAGCINASDEIAHISTGDYLFDAHQMEAVIDGLLFSRAHGYGENSKLCEKYIGGFWHGIENALEMYIQSYEETVLFGTEQASL
ncbi:MAG: hypothetical protein WCJ24_02620 [Candidatus Saccharibacteria bacterium]